jgi:hypothetical protein
MATECIDPRMDDLALRIDAASDCGDTAALKNLEVECAELLGPEGPPDALFHYFRGNIQDRLQFALNPPGWE